MRGSGRFRPRRMLIGITLGVLLGFLLGAAPATAADPSVIDPVTGASAFTYQDLSDVAAKYEGGYAAFGDATTLVYTTSPHGGYDTTTNKCKICHAVHRAEGAYYLLRADSQDDACDYCHIGGSAHSVKVVYDAGGGEPTGVTNGHTIGASTSIPDSSVYQEAVNVVLSTTDAYGNPLSQTIKVRSYDPARLSMYRFSRHHSQSAVGTGRSGYIKIGPLALRCMNCHQVHNATQEVWTTRTVIDYPGMTSDVRAGYKLLKAYPSASTTGAPNAYGNYDASQAVRVPEDDLEPGVNYSTAHSAEFVVAATGRSAPLWIAQDFTGGYDLAPKVSAPGWGSWESCLQCHPGFFYSGQPRFIYRSEGEYSSPATVNNMALSVWCADCHNLNIGYTTLLDTPELGFKAHNERTHPVPYIAGMGGPGQCYSCHRADLNRDPAGCSPCHYGTGDYWWDRAYLASPDFVESDFPHSGDAESVKLLGSYSVDLNGPLSTSNGYPIDEDVVITDDNIDAVCIRCHSGIGVHQ